MGGLLALVELQCLGLLRHCARGFFQETVMNEWTTRLQYQGLTAREIATNS
jgi:hypothetical protein